jgi:nitrite reductase/ring-hydroxylating ferredoxin subunit
MTRKEFLGKIGIGAAFLLTAGCLKSCTADASNAVDFILDLDATENESLKTAGGYIVRNQVVVVKAVDGNYYAATQNCSHENRLQIIFRNNEYYCTDHGAKFDLNGDGLNSNGSKGIAIYQTTLSGSQLRVFS